SSSHPAGREKRVVSASDGLLESVAPAYQIAPKTAGFSDVPYQHRGISLRGIARAFLGLLTGKRRGGGSTITQQLARAQFIVRPRNNFRRKLVEVLLALWVERCFTKQEILEGYLATARFERGVYGFHRAYRHYFLDRPLNIQSWEAFILVERLGNIRSRFLGRRVRQLLIKAINAKAVSVEDAKEGLLFYEQFIGHHFAPISGEPSPAEIIAEIDRLSTNAVSET
ncbi:MAG: transglycosylase domain-containing protein, partial [Nocardiopsis sp. BM-2018]